MKQQSRRAFARNGATAIIAGGSAIVLAGQEPTQRAAKLKQVIPGSPSPNFSRAVRLDHLVFVSGVLGTKPGSRDLASDQFEPQCRQVLDNLKASVEAAGSSLDHVLKCGVYLTDVADFPAFNKIYVEYFPKDPPARSTIVVKELVAPGAKVEVDCVTSVG